MKIGPSNLVHLACTPGETRSPTTESAPAIQPDADAKVSLSSLSRTLAAMESNVGEGVIDASRVASIQDAIRNGEFKINTDVVADRLIQSVKDMLGKASG